MVTCDDILNTLPDNSPIRPLMTKLVKDRIRIFEPMLASLDRSELSTYLQIFERIHQLSVRAGNRTPDEVDRDLIAGLDFHSVEFLRRQINFGRTGKLLAADPLTVYHDVYQQQEIMQRYLDGLLFTYIAWPNHYKILKFFRERYLPQGPSGRCLEIGPGHGYLALLQLSSSPNITLLGLDLSPYSVEYCKALLLAGNADPTKFEIKCEDFLLWGKDKIEPFDRFTIAEVLEHVIDPDRILRSCARLSANDAIFFITTCINIEAIDHLYRFTSVEHVRGILKNNNLRIVEELVLPLPLPTSEKLFSANYAAICLSAGK